MSHPFSILTPQPPINASVFHFLFSELVRYHQQYCTNVDELEDRLNSCGYTVGIKFAELYGCRDLQHIRHNKHIHILQYLYSTVFKQLFHKSADALEKSADLTTSNEYYIYDNASICNTYITVPKEMIDFNASAYIGGIIRGYLDAAQFTCISVTTHNTQMPNSNTGNVMNQQRTVYVIKFDKSVVQREQLYK